MYKKYRLQQTLGLMAGLFLLAGCAGLSNKTSKPKPVPLAVTAPAQYTPPCATSKMSAFECDRRSILAMAGEFRVKFAFDETAALAPGYVPHAAQRTGGSEVVLVIADSGEYISLQHILVLGKDHAVVKHWRQDWHYQPTSVLRFRGHGRFETQAVSADEARGAWSQTVYEVDDAPRYAGIGRWTHANGVDAWESDRVWRPLPRREYTKRGDYQALEVVNRHTLTPAGWVHEQDNTKLAIAADGRAHALARERGIDSYTRIADYDFGAGRQYWNATQEFWRRVRDDWDQRIAASPRFALTPEPNGEPRVEAVFTLAERVEKGGTISDAEIRETIGKYFKAY
jgi:hypothetical protein